MEQSKLINQLNSFHGDTFTFVSMTSKESLKKSRITKLPTPERFTLINTIRQAVVVMGKDYEDMVNQARRNEKKEDDFSSKGTYCSPCSKNLLLWKHNEREQYYLRMYMNILTTSDLIVRRFDKFDNPISNEEWKVIEAEYFAMSSENESQELDTPIIVNNVKLENIRYLRPGRVLINTLTPDIVTKLQRHDDDQA